MGKIGITHKSDLEITLHEIINIYNLKLYPLLYEYSTTRAVGMV
jgi:hypothetical protein